MPVSEEGRGSVLVVTLERPDVLNALGSDELSGLERAVDSAADPGVRALVITGRGRGFCSGVDLRHAREPAFSRQILRRRFHPLVLALLALDKPIVTAVNGIAAGAGASLAFLGDSRIGGSSAVLLAAFGKLGLSPDAGLTSLAPRAMGYSSAAEFILGGERWDAERCLATGALTSVVGDEVLLQTAVETAESMSRHSLQATAATLRLLRGAAQRHLSAQLEQEAVEQEALIARGEAELGFPSPEGVTDLPN